MFIFMDQQPDKHYRHMAAFALVGWALFGVTLFYGYQFYGPRKLQLGLIGGANPSAFSQNTPAPAPGQEGTISQRQMIGELVQVKEASIIVKVAADLPGAPPTEYEMMLTEQTTYSQKTVKPVIDTDGSTGGGIVTESPLTRDQLRVGDRVELVVIEKEAQVSAVSVARIR